MEQNVQKLLLEAARAYRKGDLMRAEVLLRKVVELDPNNAVAWFGLAKCTHSLALRKQYLEQALRINPHMKAAREEMRKVRFRLVKARIREFEEKLEALLALFLALIVIFMFICGPMCYGLAMFRPQKGGLLGMVLPSPTPNLTATQQACVNDFYDNMLWLLSRFFRQQAIAENTPRLNLAEQISHLEAIRTEAWKLPSKTCRPRMHAWMMDYMDNVIAAYTAFLGYDELQSQALLLQSLKSLARLDDAVIRDGHPGGLLALFREKGYFYWEGLDDPEWKDKLYKQ